ncbi:hypothetical protein Tco_0804623 [Tanacetum coccineum]|uniref:Uncharacterized protein n=1 Tax=Tanacetum coccineum TaxID=301880 RepID=A0ABQ5A5Q4_9ASTR
MKVEVTAAEQPVNVNEEEEESAEDDYELKRREKGKHVEESRSTPSPTIIRSPRIYSTLISSDTEKRQELTINAPPPSSSTPSSSSSKISATNSLLSLLKPKTGLFKRYKSFFDELQGTCEIMQESLPKMVDDRIKEFTKKQVPLYVAQGLIMEREKSQADVAKMIANAIQQECESHILHVHPTQATPTSTQEQQHQLYLTMRYNPQLQSDDLSIWLALKYKFERLYVATTPCRPSVIRPRDQDDPHDDAHLEGDNSAKRQKTSEHGTFIFEESSSGQDYESKPGPSTSGNQEQSDDFNFWLNSYVTDDDVLPNEKVSQELVDEIS